MWLFWVCVIAILSLIFRWMYKLADKIEREEKEEKQWIQWLDQIYQTQPWHAQEAQMRFNEKFNIGE